MFVVLGIVGTEVPVINTVVGTTHMNGLETGDVILEVSGEPVDNYTDMHQLIEQQGRGDFLLRRGTETLTVHFDLSPDSIPGFVPLLPTIVESSVGMPAYEAGIRSGDSIVAVNTVPVIDFSDLQREVSQFEGQFLELVYIRNGSLDTAWVEPMNYEGRSIVGVTALSETRTIKLPIGRAFTVSIQAALDGAGTFFTSLIQMIAKPADLIKMSGGPVFVAETLGQQAGFGLSRFLETIAYFSLAIMGFNLLPLPILDGGQFLFILYEGIRGKPASPKVIQIAQHIGIMLLLLLFATVIFKDISRVVTLVR
ncbi:MAG: site-2 protease family protein, partial [Candidatus Sabulitectum sp.]|nr:site-2 protease family protein [Candidatus Sabulitectum sp.]